MVEVIYYEQANKNKTIGYVDVRVPILKPTVMIFRKVAHVQSGDRRWFNLASFGREKDGTTNYFKYVEFETQVYNTQMLEAMNAKVKEFCSKHGIEEVEPMNFDKFPDMPPSSMDELPF